MQQELLKQTVGIFDSPEKWNCILELSSIRDQIRDHWFDQFKHALYKRFKDEDTEPLWDFISESRWHHRWYLKEFGSESVFLHLFENTNFILRCNPDKIDTKNVSLLLEKKYSSLIYSGFQRVDRIDINPWDKVIEDGNFNFGSPYDGKFDLEHLAWYAGNKTEEFISQIAVKVNRFRKDERMTELLYKLNEEAKLKKN